MTDSMEMPPDGTTPLLVVDGAVATIKLNRPRYRNRIGQEDLAAIETHLKEIETNTKLRALILAGTGPVFCAGYDINEAAAIDVTPDGEPPSAFARCVERLESLRVPTICRLQGGAYGGAVDLTLACDFRIGTIDCKIAIPGAKLGLHYYFAGIQRLATRIGQPLARRVLLIGEPVSASDLLRFGFLDQAASYDEIDLIVTRLANTLVRNAPIAVEGMKQTLNELARGTADARIANGRYFNSRGSADFQEGLAAFVAKRPPKFERL